MIELLPLYKRPTPGCSRRTDPVKVYSMLIRIISKLQYFSDYYSFL